MGLITPILFASGTTLLLTWQFPPNQYILGIAMAVTPSKGYKRHLREQKKAEKRRAREEAKAEKRAKKAEAERAAELAAKLAAEEKEEAELEAATRPDEPES